MPARKLKVYAKYRSLTHGQTVVPEVRLVGRWLEKSGFEIGEEIELIVNDKEILIRPLVK